MTATNSTVPPVVRSTWVHCPPAEAFEIFTEEIGAWWPLPTHGLFGDRAGGVVFRDGALVEQATDGAESVWGEVVAWEPPARLTITWHPGRGVDEASQVEVLFESNDGGTRVVLEHRGWESFGEDAMQRRRNYVGPGAWGYVLDHFSDGAEPAAVTVDLAELSTAYDKFFATAEQGGFRDAPSGEWHADQVLAHMALNNTALVAVCHALVHQQPARFENQICQDPAVLANYIAAAGSRTELIERNRTTARHVLAALARLSPEQLATEVFCHLTHEGEVALDRALPWAAVAIETQTNVHIPAHVTQLSDLRHASV